MLIIDSHVHIHDIFNHDDFLISVFNNFSKVADENNTDSSDWVGILLLTEISGVNYFNSLAENNVLTDKSKFQIQRTAESESIVIKNNNGQQIIIIAGKQIVAKDSIEVLALCTLENFETGKDLSSTIKNINRKNAIPVLPWGVGKWLGKRKKIISNFILNSNQNFFLGDNSGRPTFWNEPDLFEIAKANKHFILPGSDALSLKSEINKTGSFGFIINETIDLKKPSQSLKKILNWFDNQPKVFGKFETPYRFFRNQILMQKNKFLA